MTQLYHVITEHESEIIDALYADFKKSAFESYVTEVYFVLSELKRIIQNMERWSKRERVLPTLLNFPSSDFIYKEPYGSVLIVAPWNYPFQLAMVPLIGAYATGNTITLKPSELSTNTADIIQKIIEKVFDKSSVQVEKGGKEVVQVLLKKRWDYIFFTGSVTVGKLIARAAAEHLTPVTLELGGKNPCIVGQDAHLEITAKRIVWGKYVNAGQTCIAPDYLIVHESVKEGLIAELKKEIVVSYGENPQLSKDFPRIINLQHWSRLVNLLENQKIIFGGNSNPEELYLAPTLVENPRCDDPIMTDEIFGPILPILTFTNENEIDFIINKQEKPLALYVFSSTIKWAEKILTRFSYGGGCVNDCMLQFSNHRLPFGGVGHSGMGSYHGKSSFNLFLHRKPVVKKPTWLDIPLRYAPYKNRLKKVKHLLKWLG